MSMKRGSQNKEKEELKLLSNKQKAFQALASVLESRAGISSRLGKSFGSKRDLYEALGYKLPGNLDYKDFVAKYKRQGTAKRLVDIMPKESWEKLPTIKEVTESIEETEFEKKWKEIQKKVKAFNVMKRSDKIAGIGEYSLILFGFNDGKELNQEVSNASELLYVQPYGQWSAEIATYEENKKNERYGHPTSYEVTFTEPSNSAKTKKFIVNHTRTIHIAEDLLESNVFGTPRLEDVFNRLENLELIAGGSAEMFWQGAFQGLAFLAKEGFDITQSAEVLTEEIDKYVHGLQRHLKLDGVDIDKLSPEISSPKEHADLQLKLIALSKGIPKRIFEGSERGELASSQDDGSWTSRVEERREDFNTEVIIKPFIDKLIAVGVLPEVEYTVEWPDLKAPSAKEKAEIGKIITDAFKAWMEAGGDMTIDPLTFFSEIVELSPEKIERLRAAMDKLLKDIMEDDRQGSMDEDEEETE